MNAAGINQGTSGNVSVRVPGGMLISPSGLPYDQMKREDVVFVDNDGGYYGSRAPSSEWKLHLDIYRNCEKAEAIIHAHPTYCTALSCTRQGIPSFHYMVGAAGGSEITCTNYATFGSQELSDEIIKALGPRRACLMANHGMVCYGSSLPKAFGLAVEVETLAKQFVIVNSVGIPVMLDETEMKIILAKFQTYGVANADVDKMDEFTREHAIVPPPHREGDPLY